MDIQQLEQKLLELLDISSDHKTFALNIFKSKVANALEIGEAVKFDGLGVFQLNKKANEDSSLSLIYSATEEETTDQFLFLDLDISGKENSTEFSDEVFKLGVDKDSVGDDQDLEIKIQVEEKIDSLVDTAEVLEDFDLWDDYIKDKESKSVLDEISDDEDNDKEDYFDDDIKLDDDPLYTEDFVEVEDDEIFDDLVDNKELLNDDILDEEKIENTNIDEKVSAEVSENLKPGNDSKTENLDKSSLDELNEKFENFDDILGEEQENILDDLENEFDEELPEVKGLDLDEPDELISEDELDNLPDDYDSEVEGIVNEKISEVESDEKLRIEIEDPENDVNFKNENESPTHLGELDFDNNIGYKRNAKMKSKRSPIIYVLIAGFVIVGVIGIYYLFFDNPTWLYDKYEVETKLSEEHAKQFEEVLNSEGDSTRIEGESENEEIAQTDENIVEDNSKKDEVNNKEKVEEPVKDIVAEVKKPVEKVKESPAKISEQKTNTPPKPKPDVKTTTVKTEKASTAEQAAGENIYYDGKNYSIQISSWKDKNVAQQQAQKLINKGYSAYIVSAYISKYKATWHRVRIGPFSSLAQAKETKSKIK